MDHIRLVTLVVGLVLLGCAARDPGLAPLEERLARARAEQEALHQRLEATRRAAQAGDPRAQRQLGEMYAAGRGTAVDHAQAVRWYRAAADRGDAEAQYRLGVFLDYGV